MTHPSYALVRSNPWWGPKPETGKVAVVRAYTSPATSFLTLIDQPTHYQALVCIHPLIDKSPATMLEDVSYWYKGPDDVDMNHIDEVDLVDIDGCVIHRIAQAHYTWGLDVLHEFQYGVQTTLLGMHTSPKRQRHRLTSSPYQPHGIWEWVAPEAPFDYRARAQCTVPKTTPLTGTLEALAQQVARGSYDERQVTILSRRPFSPWPY